MQTKKTPHSCHLLEQKMNHRGKAMMGFFGPTKSILLRVQISGTCTDIYKNLMIPGRNKLLTMAGKRQVKVILSGEMT